MRITSEDIHIEKRIIHMIYCLSAKITIIKEKLFYIPFSVRDGSPADYRLEIRNYIFTLFKQYLSIFNILLIF